LAQAARRRRTLKDRLAEHPPLAPCYRLLAALAAMRLLDELFLGGQVLVSADGEETETLATVAVFQF
jgi:hypothetical protein